MLTTFEQAYEFVLEHKVVTVFGSKNSPFPSLWDNTALSEEKPASGGWSPRVNAVWKWKTELPNSFPDEIFYGKISGGDAVLMEMNHLRKIHYPSAHQPLEKLDALSQKIYEYIRIEPMFTGALRNRAVNDFQTTKSRFDTALKKLQISLNIVRSTDPALENDFWLPFSEIHFDIVEMHATH